MSFRVLGPLTIALAADSVVLAPARTTALLATLLLHPNAVVSTDMLQRTIWGDDPPVAAKAALQTCTLRLRQLFARHGIAGTTIETVPGGYRFLATAETLDLVRFRDLVSEARTGSDPEVELYVLEEALAQWRGPLLANVSSAVLQRDVVPRITEERLRVIERISDLKIQFGRARSALVGLWEVTREYPAHERIAEQLIEALYRSGRQAEALTEFRRIKAHLNEELGIDPGPGLRRLELAILRGEQPDGPALGGSVSVTAPPVARPARTGRDPAPAAVAPARTSPAAWAGVGTAWAGTPGIVGRIVVAGLIAERLAADPAIVVLTGPFGVGKTALAGHVAASLAATFPGGQQLITMRRVDGRPCAVEDVATRLEHRAGDGRRLVVLDDVSDVDQVLPLLPRLEPGAALMLTCRRSLAGLLARHGGWLHRLDAFEPDESVRLLTSVLGAQRTGGEPEALAELAGLCDHLPLALRIVATRLLVRPRLTIADAVGWVREDRVTRLALPDDPDLSLLSRCADALGQLPRPLADAFLRLGSATAAQLSIEDCAGLLGIEPEAAEHVLDQLVDASLVEECQHHYRIGQLLRRCARSLAEPAPERPVPSRPLDAKGTPR